MKMTMRSHGHGQHIFLNARLLVLIALVLWPGSNIWSWTSVNLTSAGWFFFLDEPHESSLIFSHLSQHFMMLFFPPTTSYNVWVKWKCCSVFWWLNPQCINVIFPPVPNGAMDARSRSSKGFGALPVGVPSFTLQLLLIICGRSLDARGQGRNPFPSAC